MSMREPSLIDSGESRKIQGYVDGFSLVELLAACAIMVIIALIVAQFFQKASLTWDVGSRKAEAVMKGRAVVNAIVQDLQWAIPAVSGGYPFEITANSAKFWMLGNPKDGKRAMRYVEFELAGGEVTRKVTYYPADASTAEALADGIISIVFSPVVSSGELPPAITISITLTNQQSFQSTAWLINRNHSRL